MANLSENNAEGYNWEEEGIYQLEVTDPVEGGANGVANRQAQELALRTRNLHNRTSAAESKLGDVAPGNTAVGTVRGGVEEAYDTLLKLRNWVNQQLQALGGGEELTGAAVRDLLQTLAGDARLDASAIKNLPSGGGDLSATEIRDSLQTLIGDARLDAVAVKNIMAQITAEQVRDKLASLTGDNRLDAASVKNIIAQITAEQVRDKLASLSGSNKLSGSSLKSVLFSLPFSIGNSTYDGKYACSIASSGNDSSGVTKWDTIIEVELINSSDWSHSKNQFNVRLVSAGVFHQKIAELEARLTALE